MNLTKRQAEISELLRSEGFLSVDSLAENYQVTTQTIRRDLTALCDKGLARRRHGGIERSATIKNLAYQSRQILLRDEKQSIADRVAQSIPNGASVAFSIGTTPEVVASALIHHKDLRIFTNNLNIAVLFCTHSTFEVHVAGGRVRNSDCDILGPGMEAFLSSYMFDFAIYGVGGVDENGTLLDFTDEEVRARQRIHENSRTTMLVLDHSKFGRSAHVRGGHISDASMVFCDASPHKSIIEALAISGSELVVCNGTQSK
ncbi:MAG: DeoR family glycerol-3-phosphate regulon repressor [Parasphingorhabdus sp.]|jgi:DeoR family glycerol-3-phosphate regulon repressor